MTRDELGALVPRNAERDIDWRAIGEAFAWFRALAACPQDPIFHAEGDVQVHTRLVTEALVADGGWAKLGDGEREILFLGALLHDVAKPATTRTTPEGRVTAPGHSRRGQIMARRILWEMALPFALREQVCHLITHHQMPLRLIERAEPQRRIHLISQQTRCDLLATLATADVLGRICPDGGELLDNIALFREMALDEGCLASAKSFPSAHSRFLYFRKPERSPDYEAFDDWSRRVTLLCGLPASGKDSWLAANHRGEIVVSLDDLREELDLDPGAAEGVVIAAAREKARIALRAGEPLIWNATNLGRDRRAGLIDLFADYRAKVTIVYCEASAAALPARNAKRARPVPPAVIERMLDRWEPPDLTECHAFEAVLS